MRNWKLESDKIFLTINTGTYDTSTEFPVGRIHRLLKTRVQANGRVRATVAVYSGTMLEYPTAEVLELAGNPSKDLMVKHINTQALQLAIRGDDEQHPDQTYNSRRWYDPSHSLIHKSLINKSSKE